MAFVNNVIIFCVMLLGCKADTYHPIPEDIWDKGEESCRNMNGSLLRDVNNELLRPISQHQDLLFWTGHTIQTTTSKDCGEAEKLCSFTKHIYNRMPNSDPFFGSCTVSRFYACPDSYGNVITYNGSYDTAIAACPGKGPHKTAQHQLKTGYYWLNETACTKTPLGAGNRLCGVYQKDIGYVYSDCNARYKAVCNIERIEISTLETTRSKFVHTTTISKTTTETGTNQETTKIDQENTNQTTSDKGYPTTFDVQHSTPLPTTSVVSTLQASTPPTNEKQRPESTVVKFTTTVQQLTTGNIAAETEHNDLSVTVGVPVSAMVVIIFLIVLVVVFVRRSRRKRKHTQTDANTPNINGIPNKSAKHHHNMTYAHSEIDTEPSAVNLYNVCETPEYNLTTNEQDQHMIKKKFDNNVNNARKLGKNNKAVELHVYDHFSISNGQYDVITSKHPKNADRDNVYNHITGLKSEDVYDSTVTTKLPVKTNTDNVYSGLHQKGERNEEIYDSTNFRKMPRNHNHGDVYNELNGLNSETDYAYNTTTSGKMSSKQDVDNPYNVNNETIEENEDIYNSVAQLKLQRQHNYENVNSGLSVNDEEEDTVYDSTIENQLPKETVTDNVYDHFKGNGT